MSTTFATHEVMDATNNMPVLAYDYPADWQAKSLLVWNYANHNNLALLFVTFFDPASKACLQLYPWENFFASQTQMMMAPGTVAYAMRVGQAVYGATCSPPMPARDALTCFVIPKNRNGETGLRIIGAAAVPNLAQSFGAADVASLPNEGAVVRIEYTHDGLALEEDFLASGFYQPPSGGQVNWGLKPIVSMRAQKGRLDTMRDTFWRILQSRRNNPAWQAGYAQTAQSLNSQQGNALRSAVYDMRANEQRTAAMMQDYQQWHQATQADAANQRWRSDEERNRQFGDLMAGRTPFHDPSNAAGNPHYVYGPEARYVWTDNQGNWQYHDDPLVDPNVNASQTWVRATPYKGG